MPKQVRQVRAIRQESARHHIVSCLIHGWQAVLCQSFDDPVYEQLVKGIPSHEDRIRALPRHCFKRIIQFFGIASSGDEQFYTQCWRYVLQFFKIENRRRIIGIQQQGYARDCWNDLLKELKAFEAKNAANDRVPSDISTRPG